MLAVALRQCARSQARVFSDLVPTRDVLGIRKGIVKEEVIRLRREFREVEALSNTEDRSLRKIFSIQFGDKKDQFDLDLADIWDVFKAYDPSCNLMEKVAVTHTKMKYLAAKMELDPTTLRGPEVRYNPEMEHLLEERSIKDKAGRKAIVYNNEKYIKHKKHEYLQEIGNQYHSFYLFKNQVKRNNYLITHSDHSKHYRYVFYCTKTGTPYDLKGKLLKQMQRWGELRKERDEALRSIELSDIKKYKVCLETLGIPPVYIPSKRMPSYKWFLDHAVSPLSEARVAEYRNMRMYGNSEGNGGDITIPKRPTRANRDMVDSAESIVEKGRAVRHPTHL